MTEPRTLLDPTADDAPKVRGPHPALPTLDGKSIALLSISKWSSDAFLDALEKSFQAEGVLVRRYRKPTYARVAPTELRQTIVLECDAVVEALAD